MFHIQKKIKNISLSNESCYEHEAVRLARCLSILGNPLLEDLKSWELHLTTTEENKVRALLQHVDLNKKIIACSVGAKVNVKNWGITNWKNLFSELYSNYKEISLMFVGASNEFDESEDVGRYWPGNKINFCGKLSPRESAAALKYAALFIGHDSGPMHLAAAVGTPCVAIFSARNLPGVWFPYGKEHKVIYHQTECFGCGLELCKDKEKNVSNPLQSMKS